MVGMATTSTDPLSVAIISCCSVGPQWISYTCRGRQEACRSRARAHRVHGRRAPPSEQRRALRDKEWRTSWLKRCDLTTLDLRTSMMLSVLSWLMDARLVPSGLHVTYRLLLLVDTTDVLLPARASHTLQHGRRRTA